MVFQAIGCSNSGRRGCAPAYDRTSSDSAGVDEHSAGKWRENAGQIVLGHHVAEEILGLVDHPPQLRVHRGFDHKGSDFAFDVERGLVHKADYPYIGMKQDCQCKKKKSLKHGVKIAGYRTFGGERRILEELKIQPVAATVCASRDYLRHGSGSLRAANYTAGGVPFLSGYLKTRMERVFARTIQCCGANFPSRLPLCGWPVEGVVSPSDEGDQESKR
ncbi:hypothetical protein SELMODRAFT_418362 [Selaginella moellendorffii]|uniref:Uncharacterized protein n=1 Tax=Selaginella moellendorffii TaxID=88036 RepID=D8S5H0_SELML|nr:hypothetical protein SELMODRAFT_418362 [Selaginella moellendorffii]